MFSGNYKLAGHTIRIESFYEKVQLMCAEYVSADPVEATLTITQEDLDFEKGQNELTQLEYGEVFDIALPDLESMAVLRKMANQMLQWNVLLFHGSAVAVDGRCYLFTAKSGTGKSTHTRLWRKLLGDRAIMVNDDKPLLHISSEGVTVYGTPWNGKHHLSTNTAVPLRSICLVTRGETNSCVEIKPENMLEQLISQSFISWNLQNRLTAISLLNILTQQVKFYQMSCNMELEAAITSYRAMAPQSLEDILRFEGTLIHHVKGVSMEPLLKMNRDLLVVERCNPSNNETRPVKLHDVVLFKRKNGQYVLHRVTEIKEDHYLITGDNCMLPEKVFPEQILGVMTHFTRKGVNHSVTEPGYLRYVKIWHSTYMLRRIYNLSTRAVRKMKEML